MTHRADQIIEAAAAAIRNQVQAAGTSVYAHRTLSFAEEQGELPAIAVNFGVDEPLDDDGAINFAFIDSLLTLEITGVAAADDEKILKAKLLELRRQAHIAIMADPKLGLAFVVDTRYGATEAPDIDASGEFLAAALTSVWQVHYHMNITDPGD